MKKEAVHIERATLTFLSDLARHNERPWFEANKDRFLAAQENVRGFVDALIGRMRQHDRISTASGRESLMRIYRDLRFSKDPSPYHARFAGGISRVKPELRGGYFFHFQPGRSYIACGFFGPAPNDLKRIRTDILHDHGTWERLLSSPRIRRGFGELTGEQLRTAPKGYPKEHPAIGLLRRKQFLLRHALSDTDVLSPDLLYEVDRLYRSVRPWFDHMSEVLTTDENGISVLGGAGRSQ